MAKRSLTIDDISCKYSEEKRIFDKNNLWGYQVLRRISYYPTWLFLRLGVSANKVTGISLIIGCVGCIFLASGSYGNTIIGALLINVWALFDYVDGNVARYNDSCSKYGEFIDALSGYTICALLFLSAGVGVYNSTGFPSNSITQAFLGIFVDNNVFLILGAWASLLFTLSFLITAKFGRIFSLDPINFFSPEKTRSKKDLYGFLYKMGYEVCNLTGLIMPILFLATTLRFLSVFVFLYSLIATSAFITLGAQIMRKMKKL